MPNHKLITAQAVTSDGNFTISSIPSTYTDLRLMYRARTVSDGGSGITFNGSGGGYNYRSFFFTDNSTPTTYGDNQSAYLMLQYFQTGSGSIYHYGNMYITNYSSATQKLIWTDATQPTVNASGFSVFAFSHVWNNTDTISSITMTGVKTGSQFYLYGISNA